MGPVDHVIIHHTWRPDVPASAGADTERSVMRGVEAFHASNGWSAAPGYQWVVFNSGRVYEAAGWGRTGVHTAGHNSDSVAVCFAIDGDRRQPSDAAWDAAAQLVAGGIGLGWILERYRLSGHRDYAAKSCPGSKTYPHIGRIREVDDVVTEQDKREIAALVVSELLSAEVTVGDPWSGKSRTMSYRTLWRQLWQRTQKTGKALHGLGTASDAVED